MRIYTPAFPYEDNTGMMCSALLSFYNNVLAPTEDVAQTSC